VSKLADDVDGSISASVIHNDKRERRVRLRRECTQRAGNPALLLETRYDHSKTVGDLRTVGQRM
jgi:hypothetical protein